MVSFASPDGRMTEWGMISLSDSWPRRTLHCVSLFTEPQRRVGKRPEAGAWSNSLARQEGGEDEGDSQVTAVSLGDSLGQHHLPGVSIQVVPVSRARHSSGEGPPAGAASGAGAGRTYQHHRPPRSWSQGGLRAERPTPSLCTEGP